MANQRSNPRLAAHAVRDPWDDRATRDNDIAVTLEGPVANLRAALAERAPRIPLVAARKPRESPKQAPVVAMLRRTEGATVAQIAEATGWQSHTVRGFLRRPEEKKKKGIGVATLDRARQVGPDKSGAKGSDTSTTNRRARVLM